MVTKIFLDGFAQKRDKTLTSIVFEILEGVRDSRVHHVIPVKETLDEPTEGEVGEVFPYKKCLVLSDKNLKKEIAHSLEEYNGATKRGFWKRFSNAAINFLGKEY